MQAILTKYLGPTNSRGSRIKASCEAGSVTVPFTYGAINAHEYAAYVLLAKLGWDDKWTLVSGALPGNAGEAHVLVWRA